MPDDTSIYSIVRGLDVEEGDYREMAAAAKVFLYQVMQAEGLIQSTTLFAEPTLGDVDRR